MPSDDDQQQCHHHGHQDPSRVKELLHQRYHFLQHQHEAHQGPDSTVPALHLDEQLLDALSQDVDYQHHREYLAIEAWLVAAFTDQTGCYADPATRVGSVLPELVSIRAGHGYRCPTACPTTEEPGCDRCPACADGDHRQQAQATFALSQLLDQAQWNAYRELQD
ncbi:hypothetical protein ACEZDB_36140 [Streptacidiphilus sp. N1-3]|uniref:Uncharacterized protein n=1 Tax=Streptacidiphilus alkalitolerans TaxID=3342712 RepID=A0ABV6XDR4_9ACTN